MHEEQICQRCGDSYYDNSSDPRCPKCRDMFKGLKNGDGKNDFINTANDDCSDEDLFYSE